MEAWILTSGVPANTLAILFAKLAAGSCLMVFFNTVDLLILRYC